MIVIMINNKDLAVVSVIIPTFNRAYTLELVLPTILCQPEVAEVIVVDDGGSDHTREVISCWQDRTPSIALRYHRNQTNCGALLSRMAGAQMASSEYIAFCDDDDLIASDYFSTCLKLLKSGSSIASGIHFYRLPKEGFHQAIFRYQSLPQGRPLNRWTMMLNKEVRLTDVTSLPFTHGLIVAKKALILRYMEDEGFEKGNGFREESIFQLRAYADGHVISVTPKTFAIGLHRSEVPHGGQRISRLRHFMWTIRYNWQFYKRFWPQLSGAMGISYNAPIAQFLFILEEIYRFFIRPFIIFPKMLLAKLARPLR